MPTWTSLFAFGDSFSDTGAGYVDANGPTAVAYLADRLGTRFTHAADTTAGPDSGLNFAVSGGTTGDSEDVLVGDALLGRGVLTQIADFASRLADGSVRFDPAATLFFLAGGINDGELPVEQSIANIERQVADLATCGARFVVVARTPEYPPMVVGPRLNPRLPDLATRLEAELPGVAVRVSSWGPFFDRIKAEPAPYGLRNTTDRCAGRALWGEDTTPVGDPDEYFFYHDGHPSTRVHRIVGELLERELAQAFP
jgi:phospholipase/lecithinase/hemolysin